MANRLPLIFQRLQTGWMPYLLLALLLGLTYVVLAVRGFQLGFYGDVVAYQFHYTYDGVFGGMNWLITEHWHRHLLGAWYSAPLHILAPTRYDLWYALALGLHISLGMVIFLLVDTLQDRQRRWLSFAVALFFVFDTFQTPSNIEFATGSHRKGSLIFALLSLWAYIQFVRGKRQQIGWYVFNVMTFILAIMMYEQSFFFLGLHVLIAFIEDRRTGAFQLNLRYLWIIFRDSLVQGVMVLIYVYLLLSLFVGGGNDNLQLSPGYIFGQLLDGVLFQLSPIGIIERLSIAINTGQLWLIALLGVMVFVFFGGWIWNTTDDTHTPWTALWIIGFGLALMLLNLLTAAPTVWKFDTHARLIYASSVGTGMVIAGAVAMLVRVNRRIGAIVFGFIMAILLAPGISYLYEHQAFYRAQDTASTQVYHAIYEAIPSFADDALPYLLLLTDQHPDDDLALHPQDFNFPRVFALHYGIEDFLADAILPDIPPTLIDQRIQLTDAGIISPLRPDEVIGYERVIIVAYDSQTTRATVLDTLPDEALEQGNFTVEGNPTLRTNRELLAG